MTIIVLYATYATNSKKVREKNIIRVFEKSLA